MSGFYKILANKVLDESLMIALKFRDFFSLWQEQSTWLSCHAALFSVYQILKLELANHIVKFNLDEILNRMRCASTIACS